MRVLCHPAPAGLRPAPQCVGLRGASHSAAHHALPALEVRHPGPQGEREEVRPPVHFRHGRAVRDRRLRGVPHLPPRHALPLGCERSQQDDRRPLVAELLCAADPVADGGLRGDLRVPGGAGRAVDRGVLTPAKLSKWRRWAIIGMVLFAAIVTPSSDPFLMLALAIPLLLFYEAIHHHWQDSRQVSAGPLRGA